MIDALWNVVGCIGLVALALALIGTCVLLVYGIIESQVMIMYVLYNQKYYQIGNWLEPEWTI